MQSALPLACFLSMIRPPGVQFEEALLQIAPVNKAKCPFVRDHNDIEFGLYTKHNPTVYQELIIDDDEKLFASNIDYHAPTVVYFHAFMETTDDGSAARIKESYILRGDTNIIMVDASRLEAGPWYFTAAENTWYIGNIAAKFVDFLVSRGLDLGKTHFVGHSLGAQAAGVAGSALKSGRVSRITGLDPALPLFHGLPLEQRLDKSDAEFVDVIHTDGGIFGINHPLGHADFYPNGGISPQPGCELEVVFSNQLLLNKCDNNTIPLAFYTFYFTPYKSQSTQKLDKSLQELFTKIHFNKSMNKQPMQVKKGLTTETLRDKELKYRQGIAKVEDQVMMESVNKYYKIIPYFVAINKDDERAGTMKPIIKRIGNTENIDEEIVIHDKEIIKDNKNTEIQFKEQETVETLDQEDSGHQTELKSENEQTPLEESKKLQQRDLAEDSQQKSENEGINKNLDTIAQPRFFQTPKSHVIKRQKRFINLFQTSPAEQQQNFFFKLMEFIFKQGRNIPVYSIMREINTLVRSGQGELNHALKETNNYIGAPPPVIPVTYSLELGNENKAVAFMKRLLGLTPKGDRLTISGQGK